VLFAPAKTLVGSQHYADAGPRSMFGAAKEKDQDYRVDILGDWLPKDEEKIAGRAPSAPVRSGPYDLLRSGRWRIFQVHSEAASWRSRLH